MYVQKEIQIYNPGNSKALKILKFSKIGKLPKLEKNETIKSFSTSAYKVDAKIDYFRLWWSF